MKPRLLLGLLAVFATCGAGAASSGQIAVAELPLRERPAFLAQGKMRLKHLDEVQVIETQGAWLRVRFGKAEGWLPKDALLNPEALKLEAGTRLDQPPQATLALAGKGFSSLPGLNLLLEETQLSLKGVDALPRPPLPSPLDAPYVAASGFVAPQAHPTLKPYAVTSSEHLIIGDFRPMSLEDEYHLGRIVAAQVLRNYKALDEPITSYLNTVLRHLAESSPRPLMFRGYLAVLLDAPVPLAMSAPGGFVFISKPLLRALKSEEELAAVLAHELAHLVHRHGEKAVFLRLKSKGRAKKMEDGNDRSRASTQRVLDNYAKIRALRVKRGLSPSTPELDESERKLLESQKNFNQQAPEIAARFSKSSDGLQGSTNVIQESQADRTAVEILAAAGYVASDMSTFLERQAAAAGPGHATHASWIKTHPSDESRIRGTRVFGRWWIYADTAAARTARFQAQLATLK
jgi:hypothetical protein